MSEYFYNDSELQMTTNLILCIEEIDNENPSFPIDTRLFIGSGVSEGVPIYYIRGKRQDLITTDYVPFAFNTKSIDNLYEFIKFTMLCSRINLTLYNFNNIAKEKLTKLTYEFFENLMDKNYEIAGYDNMKLTRTRITKYIKMVSINN